jgi:hypothetical protein
MENMMEKTICKITGKEFNSLRGFLNHLRTLKMTSKEYYDKYIKIDGEDICKCGNQKTYQNFKYNKFCPDKNCPSLIEIRNCAVSKRFTGNDRKEKIGGVFDLEQNIVLIIPSRIEVRKNKLDGCKKLLDWAISSQASKDCNNSFVAIYDEGSTTIRIGVESSDSKCRGSSRILEECDIVWSMVKAIAA